MKTVGIICEYNVFHNGHKHQIDSLRAMGYDCVVCVMSGNFTQRGELAIADKYTRAKSAVLSGADIVLELPFPFSSFSAEGFATSGVHILASVGVDAICFGSECADEALLNRAADVLISDEFVEYYAKNKSVGSAASFFDAIGTFLGNDTKLLSNDILGISYIAAIKKSGAAMDILPIRREGDGYRATSLSNTNPSATAIRAEVRRSANGFLSIDGKYTTEGTLNALADAQKNLLCPVFSENAEKEILSFFKLMAPCDIASRAASVSRGGTSIVDDGDGIVERIVKSAKQSRSIDDLMKLSYNSRHTDARINRVLLFSLFGVSDSVSKTLPEYTTLLAASKKGREFLTKTRKSKAFPIITKPADAPEGAQKDISEIADAFYTLAMPGNVKFDYFVKQKPFICDV